MNSVRVFHIRGGQPFAVGVVAVSEVPDVPSISGNQPTATATLRILVKIPRTLVSIVSIGSSKDKVTLIGGRSLARDDLSSEDADSEFYPIYHPTPPVNAPTVKSRRVNTFLAV